MEKHTGQEWMLTPRDMQRVLKIGSTKCYELLASGEIPSVRIGRNYRVRKQELERWLEQHAHTMG